MRIVAVGRPAEVSGFALAGVETRPCAAAADAEATVAALMYEEPRAGLVVVSPWVDRAAARAIARMRARRQPPVVVVLPETGEAPPETTTQAWNGSASPVAASPGPAFKASGESR